MSEKKPAPETKSIDFTTAEAQAVVDLLNVAVKAAGLQAARGAIYLVDKFQSAFKQDLQNKPKKEDGKDSK